MPRKSPVAATGMSAETPAVKKVSRRKNPSMPSPSNQQISPSLEPMRRMNNRSSSPLAAVVLVIVLILMAIGAYFASQYFKNKAAEEDVSQESVVTEEPAVSADVEAPVDPTANWLVFNLPSVSTSTASSSAMSFKYPSELQLTQNTNNLILSSPSVSNTQVNINWVKSKKTLKEYLAAMDKINLTSWEGQPSVAITTSTEAVVISGFPAVFRQQKLLAADLNQYVTYVKTADTVYAISLAAPELDQNLLSFFVTFLNNFKLGAQN